MRGTIALLAVLVVAGCLGDDEPGDGASDGDQVDGPPPDAEERALYDARILATAPAGFYYEGITYDRGRVFAGTAFGATGQFAPITGLNEPSRVFVYARATGELLSEILFEGEDTTQPHAAVGLKTDASARLYALSSQLGLLRFTEGADGWMQETVVQLPDLAPCSPLAGAPCSPTLDDDPAIGNDMTWDAAGNLYISDSFQATVWRLAPNGTLEIWAQDARFDRAFGPNGLRVSPDGTRMGLAVTGPDSIGELGPLDRASKVFLIPFPDPSAGDIETLLTLPVGEFADGLVYGENGDLYVLSNSGNKIFIVSPTGETTILTNDELSGDGVMDFPASAVFDGAGALLIANYAYADGQVEERRRTVVDLWFDDRGRPEPSAAGPVVGAS